MSTEKYEHGDNPKRKAKKRSMEIPKGLEEMVLQEYAGVRYNPALHTEDIVHQFKLIEDANLREEHVIVLGHPRSGNNWTLEILHMIMAQKLEYSKHHLFDLLLEFCGPHLEKLLEPEGPPYLAFHANAFCLPKQVIEKRVKILWLLRNPKDVLVSLFKICSGLDTGFNVTWEEYLDLQLKDECLWNSWIEHTLDTECFFNQHPEVPVHISVFEDMKETPVQAIRQLCRFLGKPDDLATDIAKVTSISSLKKGTQEKQELASKTFLNNKRLIQQGIIGGWKQWFTVAQSEAFDRVFEERMSGSRIASLVRPYMI